MQAQTDLKEDFSSLAKGKYGTNSAAALSLNSGDWEALKMELKENSGVKQFTFSNGTSSYLITPALDDPGKISVDWGSGGSNKLTISYSVNNGAWQQLAEISSGGSGAKSYSAKTGLDGQTNVRFKFSGSSSNTYVSKVVIKSANVVPVDPDDPTTAYIPEDSVEKRNAVAEIVMGLALSGGFLAYCIHESGGSKRALESVADNDDTEYDGGL